MDISAIQAQQEKLNREGQTPPDGNYVGYAVNLVKVVDTKNGRSLLLTFRADSRIEGAELRSAKGFDLVDTFVSYSGTSNITTGSGETFTKDNAAEAIKLFTKLGLDAYGIKAIFDAADNADLSTRKSAIIASNKEPLMDENGSPVNVASAGTPVKLVIKTADSGKTYVNVRMLSKQESALVG